MKWFPVVSVAIIVLVAGMCLILLASSGDRITRANYDRIQIGMTIEQVESVLGQSTEFGCGPGGVGLTWRGGTYNIHSEFLDGTMVTKMLEPALFARIRDWFMQ